MAKKILVVDDDPVVRILVQEYLGSQGYDVETLESGSACLKKLNESLPDVLLLDLLMPDMTGIDVLKALRNSPQAVKLPIVMLSADTETESVVQLHQVAADRYVHKPFVMKEILSVVEDVSGVENNSVNIISKS